MSKKSARGQLNTRRELLLPTIINLNLFYSVPLISALLKCQNYYKKKKLDYVKKQNSLTPFYATKNKKEVNKIVYFKFTNGRIVFFPLELNLYGNLRHSVYHKHLKERERRVYQK